MTMLILLVIKAIESSGDETQRHTGSIKPVHLRPSKSPEGQMVVRIQFESALAIYISIVQVSSPQVKLGPVRPVQTLFRLQLDGTVYVDQSLIEVARARIGVGPRAQHLSIFLESQRIAEVDQGLVRSAVCRLQHQSAVIVPDPPLWCQGDNDTTVVIGCLVLAQLFADQRSRQIRFLVSGFEFNG